MYICTLIFRLLLCPSKFLRMPLRLQLKKSNAFKIALPKKQLFLIPSYCQKWSHPYNPKKNGWLQHPRWKKSPYLKESVAQADPANKANMIKKMDGLSLLLFSNKMTHYFKEWTTASGVLIKIYCPYKNLMLQIDPIQSSCSQKLQHPKTKLRLLILRISSY